MAFHEISVVPNDGGTGEVLSITTSSVQSAVNNSPNGVYYLYFCDVVTFMRQGSNPTAVANTDMALPASTYLRMGPVAPGNRLAFRGAASGTAYLSKEV